MACLDIVTGIFRDVMPWQSGETSEDGIPIDRDTRLVNLETGPNQGLYVRREGSESAVVYRVTPGEIKYIIVGSPAKYVLAVRRHGDRVSSSSRTLFLINTSERYISHVPVMVSDYLTTEDDPRIITSQLNGDAFFAIFPISSGTEHRTVDAAIYRRDNGAEILSPAYPFIPVGTIEAEATNEEFIIRGTSLPISAPRGVSGVRPDRHIFNVPFGPGVPAHLSKTTESFTITNTRSAMDCLKVDVDRSSVRAPYSIVTPLPFPPIEPLGSRSIEVKFQPSHAESSDEEPFDADILLTLTSGAGDHILRCRGTTRPPVRRISTSGPYFGSDAVPLSEPRMRNLTITNEGDLDVTIDLAPSTGEFAWGDFRRTVIVPRDRTIRDSGTLHIPITFTPEEEGERPGTLTFTSDALGSRHTVNFSGIGCVANAGMAASVLSLPFGHVQRGFRAIRLFKVMNTGDGRLEFEVKFEGTDATLFGILLPPPSGCTAIDPCHMKTYTIDPKTACGSGIRTGTGEETVAVIFYADGAPGTIARAQLILEAPTATSPVPPRIVLDLEAVIDAPLPIDVELVLDRSGSMHESIGIGSKAEAAVRAGKLFVELSRVDVEDRIGVVRFNNRPEVVPSDPPASIQEITAAGKAFISSEVIKDGNFRPEGSTCIAGGAMVAQTDMSDHERSPVPDGLKKAIVILTDGKDNTPYIKDRRVYTLMGPGGRVGFPVLAGAKYYAVGIGREEDIDKGQLSLLAEITGAKYFSVKSFSIEEFYQLEKLFTQIYMEQVDMDTIADPIYTLSPHSIKNIPFEVQGEDTKIMVVIYDKDGIRLPFYLKSPPGEMIDITSFPPDYQVRYGITPTARFIELLLPQNMPERYAGTWMVTVNHDGRACTFDGRLDPDDDPARYFDFGFQPRQCRAYSEGATFGIAIGAGSNFRMKPYVQPGIISTGESIRLSADITEFTLPVTRAVVTVEALSPDGRISIVNLYDDGSHLDREADDGFYGNVYDETFVGGSYQFTFRADGTSRSGRQAHREYVLSKYVQGRIPLIPGDEPNKSEDGEFGRYTFIATAIIIVMLAVVILILLFR